MKLKRILITIANLIMGMIASWWYGFLLLIATSPIWDHDSADREGFTSIAIVFLIPSIIISIAIEYVMYKKSEWSMLRFFIVQSAVFSVGIALGILLYYLIGSHKLNLALTNYYIP